MVTVGHEHVMLNGIRININPVDMGEVNKILLQSMEKFPLGCRVKINGGRTYNLPRGSIFKVVGYSENGGLLVHNPSMLGHSGWTFFVSNEHLRKDLYTKSCVFVSQMYAEVI